MRTHAARVPSVAAPLAALKPLRAHPAVRAILRGQSIQPKLKIGAVDDPLEHEADRVAALVMRMPAPELSIAATPPHLGRKCADCEADEEKLQRKPTGPQSVSGEVPAIVHEVLRSPGEPLDDATRAFMEARFGYDFCGVRVHTSASAEHSARDVNAHAYTVGHNVVFGAGRFAPGTHQGRQLIAHELTHVVQQSGADVIRVDQSDENRDRSRQPPVPRVGRDRIEFIASEGDGLLTLQQTAGKQAVAGELRTVSVQRDKAGTVVNDQWTRVVDGYMSLIGDIGMVNQKVMSPTRTEWLNELAADAAQIGGPGDLDAAALGRLEAALANYKEMIDRSVTSAREHWKELLEESEKERATLTDGQGSHPRALKFLDQRAKDGRNTVFFAWKYLTFDDTAGLQSMLDEKRHLTFVEQQDEEERRRRHKEDSRKLPLFRHFRIRALAGGQVSAGPVGANVSTFEIEELGTRGRSGTITFVAEGLSAGLKAGAIGPQSWAEFETSAEMRIEDFEGAGRMTSAGGYFIYGGGYSVLTFFAGNKPTVQVKSWGHGWGLGGGAETVVGIWTVRSVD